MHADKTRETFVERTIHTNQQSTWFATARACRFCKQMDLTGTHARACPGKAADIRTWTESTTDRDGYLRPVLALQHPLASGRR